MKTLAGNFLFATIFSISLLWQGAGELSAQNIGINTDGSAGATLLHTKNTVAGQHNYLTIENSQTGFQSAVRFLNSGTAGADWVQYIPGGSTALRFYRGADLVTFLSSGLVGIGTTGPVHALEVKNAGNGFGFTTTDFNSTTNVGSIFQIQQGATTGNTYTQFKALSSGWTVWNNLVMQAGGGNVGIGTTSPGGKLDISGGYSSGAVSVPAGLAFAANGASPDRAQIWWGDNTGWKLNFGTRNGSGNFQSRVTFMDVGNVGIGTMSPASVLQVRDIRSPLSNTSNAGAVLVSATNNGGSTPSASETVLALVRNGVSSQAWENVAHFALSRYAVTSQNSKTQLDINLTGQADDNSTLTNVMSLRSNGNVGIGTTAPSSRLYVNSTDPSLAVGQYFIHSPAITANTAANMHSSWSELIFGSGFNFTGDNYGAVHRVTANASQTGTVFRMMGSINDVSHAGAGTLTSAYGAIGNVGNYAGTITNAYGLSTTILNSGGVAITNAYGLYVETIQGTNKWSVYAADASAPSFFAGNVGIGKSVSAQYSKLDVEVGVQDGIAFYQPSDNNMALQGYIDGQWANRTTYAGGCCNNLLLQPDVGNVGIGVQNPGYKLSVNGDASICGTIRYTALSGACSDIRYKKDIIPLNNALDNVLKLQGVNYFWKTKDFPDKLFSEDRQLGFIAQEIEKIYPELVITDNEGYKSVDYSRLTPILVEAMKEQQNIIDAQRSELENIKIDNKITTEKYNLLINALIEKGIIDKQFLGNISAEKK